MAAGQNRELYNLYRGATERAEGFGNEVNRQLSTQLNVVSGILLGFVSTAFTKSEVLSSMSSAERIIIFLAFVFFGLSIACGVIQILVEKSFFSAWGKVMSEITKKIALGGIVNPQDIQDEIDSASLKLGTQGPSIALYIQIALLALALVLALVVAGLVII